MPFRPVASYWGAKLCFLVARSYILLRGFCIRVLGESGAEMSTLIVIPARLGSSRLPQKPLRDLAGKPLIVRVLERVRAVYPAADAVVAADSRTIADAVTAAGGTCILTRDDHPSGTDRVAEVAELPEYRGYDVLVNVQGDEPFITAEAIQVAAGFVERGDFPIGTAACRDAAAILDDPSVVKVTTDGAGRALYFSRAPIPFLRDTADRAARDARDAVVLRHVGIYAYTRAALKRWVSLPVHPLERAEQLEQLRPLADGLSIGVGVLSTRPHAGIDTEEDLRTALRVWASEAQSSPSPVAAGTH